MLPTSGKLVHDKARGHFAVLVIGHDATCPTVGGLVVSIAPDCLSSPTAGTTASLTFVLKVLHGAIRRQDIFTRAVIHGQKKSNDDLSW